MVTECLRTSLPVMTPRMPERRRGGAKLTRARRGPPASDLSARPLAAARAPGAPLQGRRSGCGRADRRRQTVSTSALAEALALAAACAGHGCQLDAPPAGAPGPLSGKLAGAGSSRLPAGAGAATERHDSTNVIGTTLSNALEPTSTARDSTRRKGLSPNRPPGAKEQMCSRVRLTRPGDDGLLDPTELGGRWAYRVLD
jgi:hypothetical protein